MASKKLYLERKLWGCCILCGKPLGKNVETLSCPRCIQKRANYRQENRNHIKESNKSRRERYKAEGLCIYCGKPAIPGRTQCEYHREYYSRINRKYFKRRKEEQQNVSSE